MKDITVSWSALRVHEECRQKGLLVRTHGRPKTTDIRNFVHGSIVDSVMRAWLEDPEQCSMVELLPGFFDVHTRPPTAEGSVADGFVRWRDPDDRQKMFNFCRELLVRLEPILNELVVPFPYQPATRFKTPIEIPDPSGNRMVVYMAGEYDLLVQRNAPLFHGMDLKGTANDSYINQTVGQGVFYDIAINHAYGPTDGQFTFILPMTSRPVIPITVAADDHAAMMARIIRMVHDMLRKDWSPKASNKGCTRCEVKHGCPKFAPKIGEDGKKRLSFAELAESAKQAVQSS